MKISRVSQGELKSLSFIDFWPMYLAAHRLPGTRALHYFATVVGILMTVEALWAKEPLVFILGITLSYMIAISAHWNIEHNQPLISVSMIWGALADLRMCWLALTGQLHNEFTQHQIIGFSQKATMQKPVADSTSLDVSQAKQKQSMGFPLMLVLASTAGLILSLFNLYIELAETALNLAYPIFQLGIPLVAFSGALIAASTARLSTSPEFMILEREISLQRASCALFSFGLAAILLSKLADGILL